MATGRNDPCPCGSGRKYKKCCLGRDAETASLAQAPWTDDDRDRALEQLDRFLDRDDQQDLREGGSVVFWGPLLEGLEEDHVRELLGNPTSQLACAYWTMFDFLPDDEQRFVERLLTHFPQRLGAGERRWLEAMRDSSVRLWELRDVEPGEGFSALDVWEGKRLVKVREHSASEDLVRWDLMVARLLEVSPGVHEIEGPCLVLPATDKRPLLKSLRQQRRRLAKEDRDVSDSASFFEIVYPLIHDHWVQTVADVPPPQLLTAEGDAMLFARVVFHVVDADALAGALAGHAALESDDGNQGSPVEGWGWDWLEPGEGDGPRRGLGRLELSGKRLTLETQSRDRAQRGRALVEELAGTAVRHRATTFEDPWQAVRNAPAPDPGEADRNRIPPADQARLLAEFQDEHYRKWLDESIPALGGLTPREAAATKTTRPQLVALLKDFESSEERGGREGRPVYDLRWIWRELGLRRPSTRRR